MSDLQIVNQYRAAETACRSRTRRRSFGAEYYGMVVLLPPLDKTTLEVGLRLIDLVKRQVLRVDVVDKQTICEVVALVEVYRTHHSLESVTEDVLLCCIYRTTTDYVSIQTEFAGYGVE